MKDRTEEKQPRFIYDPLKFEKYELYGAKHSISNKLQVARIYAIIYEYYKRIYGLAKKGKNTETLQNELVKVHSSLLAETVLHESYKSVIQAFVDAIVKKNQTASYDDKKERQVFNTNLHHAIDRIITVLKQSKVTQVREEARLLKQDPRKDQTSLAQKLKFFWLLIVYVDEQKERLPPILKHPREVLIQHENPNVIDFSKQVMKEKKELLFRKDCQSLIEKYDEEANVSSDSRKRRHDSTSQNNGQEVSSKTQKMAESMRYNLRKKRSSGERRNGDNFPTKKRPSSPTVSKKNPRSRSSSPSVDQTSVPVVNEASVTSSEPTVSKKNLRPKTTPSSVEQKNLPVVNNVSVSSSESNETTSRNHFVREYSPEIDDYDGSSRLNQEISQSEKAVSSVNSLIAGCGPKRNAVQTDSVEKQSESSKLQLIVANSGDAPTVKQRKMNVTEIKKKLEEAFNNEDFEVSYAESNDNSQSQNEAILVFRFKMKAQSDGVPKTMMHSSTEATKNVNVSSSKPETVSIGSVEEPAKQSEDVREIVDPDEITGQENVSVPQMPSEEVEIPILTLDAEEIETEISENPTRPFSPFEYDGNNAQFFEGTNDNEYKKEEHSGNSNLLVDPNLAIQNDQDTTADVNVLEKTDESKFATTTVSETLEELEYVPEKSELFVSPLKNIKDVCDSSTQTSPVIIFEQLNQESGEFEFDQGTIPMDGSEISVQNRDIKNTDFNIVPQNSSSIQEDCVNESRNDSPSLENQADVSLEGSNTEPTLSASRNLEVTSSITLPAFASCDLKTADMTNQGTETTIIGVPAKKIENHEILIVENSETRDETSLTVAKIPENSEVPTVEDLGMTITPISPDLNLKALNAALNDVQSEAAEDINFDQTSPLMHVLQKDQQIIHSEDASLTPPLPSAGNLGKTDMTLADNSASESPIQIAPITENALLETASPMELDEADEKNRSKTERKRTVGEKTTESAISKCQQLDFTFVLSESVIPSFDVSTEDTTNQETEPLMKTADQTNEKPDMNSSNQIENKEHTEYKLSNTVEAKDNNNENSEPTIPLSEIIADVTPSISPLSTTLTSEKTVGEMNQLDSKASESIALEKQNFDESQVSTKPGTEDELVDNSHQMLMSPVNSTSTCKFQNASKTAENTELVFPIQTSPQLAASPMSSAVVRRSSSSPQSVTTSPLTSQRLTEERQSPALCSFGSTMDSFDQNSILTKPTVLSPFSDNGLSDDATMEEEPERFDAENIHNLVVSAPSGFNTPISSFFNNANTLAQNPLQPAKKSLASPSTLNVEFLNNSPFDIGSIPQTTPSPSCLVKSITTASTHITQQADFFSSTGIVNIPCIVTSVIQNPLLKTNDNENSLVQEQSSPPVSIHKPATVPLIERTSVNEARNSPFSNQQDTEETDSTTSLNSEEVSNSNCHVSPCFAASNCSVIKQPPISNQEKCSCDTIQAPETARTPQLSYTTQLEEERCFMSLLSAAFQSQVDSCNGLSTSPNASTSATFDSSNECSHTVTPQTPVPYNSALVNSEFTLHSFVRNLIWANNGFSNPDHFKNVVNPGQMTEPNDFQSTSDIDSQQPFSRELDEIIRNLIITSTGNLCTVLPDYYIHELVKRNPTDYPFQIKVIDYFANRRSSKNRNGNN